MDLIFDVFDDYTKITSDLHAESRDNPLPEIVLNVKNPEIITVSCPRYECSHKYDAA